MLLKFWAFIYRHTGFFSDYARVKEYQHILSTIDDIDDMKSPASLRDAIGLQTGMWQANNGFYRRMKKFRR